MNDLVWIAKDAENIHHFLSSIFYLMVSVLLVVGVVIEYFKLPLGGIPSVPVLVGRVLIAAILLHSFPEITQVVSDLSKALSLRLGDPNQFFLVRAKMADKFAQYSTSWVSIKETLTVAIAYVSFLLFHFSIYVAEAFQLYTWVLLYIFSPLLIALFVLPATSGATSALYRSLIEVSCWHPVWSVTATILWSTALSDINKPGADISFLTVICYSLILAGSLVLTPLVVHSLAGAGLTSLTKNLGAIGLGATALPPLKFAQLGRSFIRRTQLNRVPGTFGRFSYNAALSGADRMTRQYPRANRAIRAIPKLQTNQYQAGRNSKSERGKNDRE